MSRPGQLYSRRLGIILLLGVCLLITGVALGNMWRTPWVLLTEEWAAVLEIRLWRVAVGALAGASLAISGSILQAVLRNPLAEPYVLGLSAGAGLGTALAIIAGGLAVSLLLLPAAGFLGAVLSLAVVYQLARTARGTTPHTLILAGVVWGAMTGSLLMFLVSQSSAAGLHALLWWLLGDLQVFDTRLVIGVAVVNGSAAVILFGYSRRLNAMLLGDEGAAHVGVAVERTKVIVLGLATLLAAATVSVCGIISFVGLIAPHTARSLVGADHHRLLPASAMLGAVFLVWADGIGRMILFPVEIPVGVFTALVGGPFFLLLLRRHQRGVWT